MTINCDYDSVVGVILSVEDKILPIVHLILKLIKTLPLFYTFCQKHSGCVFASGKNGSTPFKRQAQLLSDLPSKNVIHKDDNILKSKAHKAGIQ